MTIPDSAFRYLPDLLGKVIQPEDSKMRLSMDDLHTFDKNARKQGRPKPWRLSDEDRESNRKKTLEGHEGKDLWVLAYGSLIWDPSLNTTELRQARVPGRRRHFCYTQTFGRGSPEHPGLTLALDVTKADEHCDAIAMLIPADRVEIETTFLWRREMIAGSYIPKFLNTETPQGDVQSLAFVVDPGNPRYVDLSVEDAACQIAAARGPVGTNTAYLENLVANLNAVGLNDPAMDRLLAAVHEA
jgi:cation transport protein ChaC